MSIHRSYFSKNNTIYYNSYANTGRNPVMDLYFGDSFSPINGNGYSRFIFDLNLTPLLDKISQGIISTGCTTGMTHILNMTNTIRFDDDLINSFTSNDKKRASSFDLVLFRIPKTCYNHITGCTATPQSWDEGVGYDAFNPKNSIVNYNLDGLYTQPQVDNSYSVRPSNWYERLNTSGWTVSGMYSNVNSSDYVNYSDLTIVGIQHFDKGNEDINFDMTSEINGIINGSITGVTGWGIAFRPDIEIITGLTSSYSVSFFTRYTQTFYEPYLLTSYNDLISDNRNLFTEKTTNKLYMFSYINGDLVNMDSPPTVNILNPGGDPISGFTALTTCLRTKGVYEVIIPPLSGYNTPCQFTDVWTDLTYGGESIPDVENEFTLQPYGNRLIIGSQSKDPEQFGFDFYGIKQDEKILNTDVRKVGVIIKKAYTTKQLLQDINVYYRVYVMEGTTEVQVEDWAVINRTPNEFYFIFDTRDKIPNEYYIDIKVLSSGEITTYKRTVKFLIVNKK